MPQITAWLARIGQGDILLFAGSALLLVALVLLVTTVGGWFGGGRRRPHSARRERVSITGQLIRVLSLLVLLFFALSLLLGGAALRTYTVFTHEETAGTLECLQTDPGRHHLIVRFTPRVRGTAGRPQTYTLAGDSWEVSAHILKWTPKTIQLGFHTAFRLNMLKGVYQTAEDETRLPHQAYALTPGSDWVWRLLSRYGQKLPFIESVYGNAVSNPAVSGDVYDLFVTTSGLAARRR